MSSLKKVLAFAVVLAMVLGVMAPAFAASVPSDVVGTEYETAATRLAHFNIMVGDETGSFAASREITRAEMTKIVVAMQGLADAAALSQGATPFADVAADHWASGYINVAYDQGMVKGTSATTFDPDRKVTYQEALTMIVRACGYVNLQGSWPANYVSKAAQIGVTAGVPVAGSANGVRGMIAKLVNNALDAKPMKVSKVDANGVPLEYEVEDDKTVLTKYFTLAEKTGIPAYTHKEDPDVEDGYISVLVKDEDGDYAATTYKLGSVDLSGFIGKEIVFYVNDDATPVVMGVKEVKTTSDNIITTEKFLDSTDTQISYKDSNDKTKSVAFDTVKGFIFNGKKETYDDEGFGKKFVDDSGDLSDGVYAGLKQQDAKGTIVKLGGGEIFLVVDIWSEPAVVTNVNKSAETISVLDTKTGGGGTTYSIDVSDDDTEYTITRDGDVISLDDVEKDDVVEILASDDKDRYEVVVTSNAVSGKIEGLAYSGDQEIEAVKINGTEYLLNDPVLYNPTLSTGSTVKALLDKDGEIEKVTAEGGTSISGNYAVVLGVEEQVNASFGGMVTAPKIQLLLADGTKKSYDGIEDLRVYEPDGTLSTAIINDGTFVGGGEAVDRDNKALSTYTPALTNDANVGLKIVKFETNSSEKISKVSLMLTADEKPLDASYTEDSSSIGNYIMTSSTIVFNVSGTTAKVYKYTDLPGTAEVGQNYVGSVVKVPDDDFNRVEVVYISNVVIPATSSDIKVAMVTSVNNQGDDTYVIGLNDGSQVFTLETDEDYSGSVYPRDLVVYKVSGSNKITEAEELLAGVEGAVELFASNPNPKNLVKSVNVEEGLISVSYGTYTDKYTESVGTSPVIFDISDYYPTSTVSSSARKIRTLTLGGLEADKMYIEAYKIKVDDVDKYFILVRQDTDTDGE